MKVRLKAIWPDPVKRLDVMQGDFFVHPPYNAGDAVFQAVDLRDRDRRLQCVAVDTGALLHTADDEDCLLVEPVGVEDGALIFALKGGA